MTDKKENKSNVNDNTETINIEGRNYPATKDGVCKLEEVMITVNDYIMKERRRQNKKWGHQVHDDQMWLTIALEEVGESAQAILKHTFAGKVTDADNLYKEVIQSAAVFQAWAEQIYRHLNHIDIAEFVDMDKVYGRLTEDNDNE